MIVSKLGSHLQVKSPVAENRGTCFYFTVKLKRVLDVIGNSPSCDSLKLKETVSQSLSNIRVLVSDIVPGQL